MDYAVCHTVAVLLLLIICLLNCLSLSVLSKDDMILCCRIVFSQMGLILNSLAWKNMNNILYELCSGFLEFFYNIVNGLTVQMLSAVSKSTTCIIAPPHVKLAHGICHCAPFQLCKKPCCIVTVNITLCLYNTRQSCCIHMLACPIMCHCMGHFSTMYELNNDVKFTLILIVLFTT